MNPMKPIHFCSFGGYRLFCRSWWNDLFSYTLGIDFSGWLVYRELPNVPWVRGDCRGGCVTSMPSIIVDATDGHRVIRGTLIII